MTHMETIMLAMCFGAVIGTTLGNIAMIIKFSIENYVERKHREENTGATNE